MYNGGTKSPRFSHKTSLPHSSSFCLPVPGIREREELRSFLPRQESIRLRLESIRLRLESIRLRLESIRLRVELIRLRPICLTRENFMFWDEDVYKNEIFPILSSARARTNVILAGKYGSRRQSTTSFGENVIVAKTSDQMLEILSFLGCLFVENRRENLTLNHSRPRTGI